MRILIAILLVALTTLSFSWNNSKKSFSLQGTSTKFPKEIIELTGNLVYVPNGSFISGFDNGDSVWVLERVVTVASFFMADGEVTNAQYKKFYRSMIDLVGKDSAQKLLPDTNSFKKDILYGDCEVMIKNYFNHEAYNDYPVIGVNWYQAYAYTQWLTLKLDELYKLHPDWIDKYGIGGFRLPSEMEWEYAAKGVTSTENRYTMYAWGNLLASDNKKGNWLGNFGQIKDQSGILIKSHIDDGNFYSNKKDSYKPNAFGLYNLSGNVNEWVADTYRVITKDAIFMNRYDTTIQNGKRNFIKCNDSDFKSNVNHKVIKGGGYLDGPAWCIPGNRRAMAPDSSRCDVGFRVCSIYVSNFEHKK